MNRKYLLIGIAALSFGSGIMYERWRIERKPYLISERNGSYLLIDKQNNKEYEVEQISKIHKIMDELLQIINKKEKLEEIVEGEEDGRKQQ